MLKKLFILFAAASISTASPARVPETVYDIVVYGGTSAGVVAAVQAREMG